MGLLIDGKWHDKWYDTSATGGRFVRQQSTFRNFIGSSDFPAEPNRYRLYISHACPWAHRTVIFRLIKSLESIVDMAVVDPVMLENGWEFKPGPDIATDAHYLHELYTRADKTYTGRVTVPFIWDIQNQTIVNNESSDIIRMFNSAFNTITDNYDDYYPEHLKAEIDAVNDTVYHAVNNGVYKVGFATQTNVYEKEFDALFTALDQLDHRLASQRYLVGDRITEADWRLFPTLVRFDSVYVGHFKCNLRRIADYKYLFPYLCDLYQMPGLADTVVMDHIKIHYYASHPMINPTGIVPKGPFVDFNQSHYRS